RRRYETRVDDRRKVAEIHAAAAELLGDTGGHLESQPRLAGARRAHDGDDAAVSKQTHDLVYLARAPHKTGRHARRGHGRGGQITRNLASDKVLCVRRWLPLAGLDRVLARA